MPVRVVADSNCDLPRELVTRFDILIVPSLLNMQGRSYPDGVDLSRGEFYRRLPGLNPLPTTAAPAVGAFEAAFRQCGDASVVCLTLAAAFSAIHNAARLGAEPPLITEATAVIGVHVGPGALGVAPVIKM